MKRFLIIFAFAIVALASQFFANCSDPLDTGSSHNLTPVAPGGDTIVYIDTIFVFDSTYQFDTLVIIDSTSHVDTVIIVEPGPNGPLMLCSRLACNQKSIIWMFRNEKGSYRLEFTAATKCSHPTQKLVLNIDGHSFFWDTSRKQELVLDKHLNAHAKICIYSTKPRALGHSIDICLTMTRL
jgi:hypothetical protein